MLNNSCDHITEVYSRVVGFYRPIKQWNPGMQSNFKDRKEYKISWDEGKTLKSKNVN